MEPVDPVRYQPYVTSLDLPVEELDVLIDIVHSIMSYFVDQAFKVQTDQITLQSAGNSFNTSLGRDTIENHPENQTADAPSHGVEEDSNPQGPSEP
jgi:hypothetical protein